MGKNQYTQRKPLYFEKKGSASSSKIGHDFRNKVGQKLTLSINHFHKKCAPNQLFFNEKKSKRFFDIENSL